MKDWNKIVDSNIRTYGHHLTLVSGAQCPRFAYSIGLQMSLSFELIFAGAILFLKDEVMEIMNTLAAELNEKKLSIRELEGFTCHIKSKGRFSLKRADASWARLMALGAYKYGSAEELLFFQIFPDKQHFTLDIPDLTVPFNSEKEPAWKYLNEEWNMDLPEDASVIVNIGVLKGEVVTELMRWEENEWEMFSRPGPSVPKKHIRVLPFYTLLAMDHSLLAASGLKIGKGLWRDSASDDWQDWG